MLSRTLPSKFIIPTLTALMLGLAACAGNGAATESATQPEAAAPTVVEEATQPAAEEAPAEETSAEEAAVAETTTEENTAAVAEVAAVPMTKLDLNSVTGDDLLSTIPDFGDRMVREFMEYRPYISIQEFRREIGKYVDEAQVADYEQYVYVPVDVNESDAETLKQLPGVDDAVAETLMAARPFDSNDAFLSVLAESVSAEDAAAASGYLAAQ